MSTQCTAIKLLKIKMKSTVLTVHIIFVLTDLKLPKKFLAVGSVSNTYNMDHKNGDK